MLSLVQKPRFTGDRECGAILETHSPSRLLFPSCFTIPYECSHDLLIVTVWFPVQELQDFRPAAPVWSETMMSADQNPKATAALPRVAVPSCPQHPVSWFEHLGIEERIGDS